ncbi:MAG: KamA family radical SAM protein [Polyangia bacterium]|jgi:lysine 2,3-aminomutase|nr:KamA family radical SAM protein [Polyangia bacterium]
MSSGRITDYYGEPRFRAEAARFLDHVSTSENLEQARERLADYLTVEHREAQESVATEGGSLLYVVRDCARALRSMLHRRAEVRSEFSLAQAIWDLSRGKPREELSPAFYAELTQLVIGLEGRFVHSLAREEPEEQLTGREAALRRSEELDRLWERVEGWMRRYPDGLSEEASQYRVTRRERVLAALEAKPGDFDSWQWQVSHIAREAEELGRLVELSADEREAIGRARRGRLPFGVTPYYASLLDDDPKGSRDRALRAQVIPPSDYVDYMIGNRGDPSCSFDFMLERDTSPAPLVTRRYPAIAIFKPFNTCPQICVYCQRNWEIDEAMAHGALAAPEVLEEAFEYLEGHPAIREVLLTGGDPLGLPDELLLPIVRRLASIPHVDVLRIGTRTPVTLPMRITEELAVALGALRKPGRLELAVVTHVEHAYELTPALVTAVDRLRRSGIPVYNQLVYSFFVSRRFEAAKLRMMLKRVGIDPYYTFSPKGKEETKAYRVPLPRLLQEQKEEARLLPGSRRMDESVYNVPGLGKNHLRAYQHRDLISVLPSGSRVYDFHPWEKGIAWRDSYVGLDVPVLEYLQNLQDIGEDPRDYDSIWYYY